MRRILPESREHVKPGRSPGTAYADPTRESALLISNEEQEAQQEAMMMPDRDRRTAWPAITRA
jgi:hypothetical protein